VLKWAKTWLRSFKRIQIARHNPSKQEVAGSSPVPRSRYEFSVAGPPFRRSFRGSRCSRALHQTRERSADTRPDSSSRPLATKADGLVVTHVRAQLPCHGGCHARHDHLHPLLWLTCPDRSPALTPPVAEAMLLRWRFGWWPKSCSAVGGSSPEGGPYARLSGCASRSAGTHRCCWRPSSASAAAAPCSR